MTSNVRFKVADVVHPRPTQVLMELFRERFLEGQVLGETTDGEAHFFVVRVQGVAEPVIVPDTRAESAAAVVRNSSD